MASCFSRILQPPNKPRMEGTKLSDLPTDLLAKILLSKFIGIKTLCKLRCVCKQWCKVLSDPFFQSLHHESSKKIPKLLFLDFYKDMLYSIDLDLEGDKEEGNGSSLSMLAGRKWREKGMLHMLPSSSSARDLICLVNPYNFYLCNPSLKELIRLPEPDVAPIESNFGNIVYPSVVGGLGFIATRNEYVVIHVIFSNTMPRSIIGCEILIFSVSISTAMAGDNNNNNHCSRSGSLPWGWRKIGDNRPHEMKAEVVDPCGTFVDGIFYWKISGTYTRYILSFNLNEENFEDVSPPATPGFSNPYIGYSNLVELKGNLCLVDASAAAGESTPTVEVWMLIKEKKTNTKTMISTWKKELSIALPGFDPRPEDFAALGDRDGDGSLIIYTSGKSTTATPQHGEEGENFFRQEPSLWYYNRQSNDFRKLKSLKNFGILQYVATRCLCLHTDNFFSFRSRGASSSPFGAEEIWEE